jgi:acetylornithine deacetylase/succinyl-diaminopimelate desuccinylase-like protein
VERPALRDLEEWLRIPSVSGSRAHRDDVRRAAAWVARWLARLPPRVAVVPARGGPVVLARVGPGRPGTPLLVVYGHLDVRPPGPGWTSDPFVPVVRGRRLVARGASDDKGQLFAHLLALRAVGSRLPGDVLVVVDGAEEVGSPGLASALAHPLTRGRPVAVLVSDTRVAAPGVPSLTVMQRGSLALRVAVDAGGPAVHAGRLGGAVLDPTLVLAERLVRLDRSVRALRTPAPVRTDPGVDVLRAARGRAVHRGDLVARTTTRGALTVTAVRGDGGPGAVAARAEAALDVRVPPGVPLDRARAAVRREFPGVRELAAARSLTARLPAWVLAAVRTACLTGYGAPPRLVASGGSIPAVAVLLDRFAAPPVLLGTGPVDDGAHGPDEHLDLPDWRRAVRTSQRLLPALLHGPQWPGRVIAAASSPGLSGGRRPCHGLSPVPTGRLSRDTPTRRT